MQEDTMIINNLKKMWSKNKAIGLLSQVKFLQDLKSQILAGSEKKYYDGCWLLAPNVADYYKYRFSFFIHPKVENISNTSDIDLDNIMGEVKAIKFKRVAWFLYKAGVDVIYSIPIGNGIQNISWHLFRYDLEEEKLLPVNANDFFAKWSNRGRVTNPNETWTQDIEDQYTQLDKDTLISLYLKEHFYTEYIKNIKKISVSDPYDVDGFFAIDTSGIVIPVEIKEKSPAGDNNKKFFGIDAGRVLMLLRLCLPNNLNALYIIREVKTEKELDNTTSRKFIGWKYITLSDIIMSSSWNLLGGGKGMGGQQTQTIKLPYDSFRNLDKNVLKDSNLDTIGRMPDEIKKKLEQLNFDRRKFFGW